MTQSQPPEDQQTYIDTDNIGILGDHAHVEGGIHFGQKIINFFTSTLDQQRELRNRQIMLQRVHDFWVKGVLENSLYNEVLIDVGMETRPDTVDYPWEMVIQRPDQPNHTLPRGTEIINVFDESGDSLLILGEPGSGKTTLLLNLTGDLINRAEQVPTQPIPVVFNLSSWSESRSPLIEWLVTELNAKYNIPRKIARPWIEDDELLLLLDGLDEVAKEWREACVETINTFRQEHLVPLAVCSRIADYETLSVRLKLQGAVLVQSLTPQQVEAYLARTELEAVQPILQEDEDLQKLAQSPLMLSIVTLAYRGLSAKTNSSLVSTKDRRRNLFDTYIQQMFARRGVDGLYDPEQTTSWLTWLAQGMNKHAQTVFMIEELQPSWLPNQLLLVYTLISRLIIGMVIGLSFTGHVPNSTMNTALLLAGLVGGSIWGIIDSLRFSFQRTGKLVKKWEAVILVLVTGLIIGLSSGCLVGLSTGSYLRVDFSLFLGLAFVLVITRRGIHSYQYDIRLTEKLVVSKKNSIKGIGVGVVCGLIFGLIITPISGGGNALLFGLLLGLGVSVISSLRGEGMETKNSPNIGVFLTARNAIMVGILAGCGVLLIWIIISGWIYSNLMYGVERGLPTGWTIGLLAVLWYGAADVIQHYILRLVIHWQNYAPLRLVPFLDYCVDRIFLRHVGGGYIFIHRYLMEYFASLTEEDIERLTQDHSVGRQSA